MNEAKKATVTNKTATVMNERIVIHISFTGS